MRLWIKGNPDSLIKARVLAGFYLSFSTPQG
jgi:hypothetical protein